MDEHCYVDLSDHGDDADPVEFLNVKRVRARKVHTCTECGSTIAKNESYTRATYRYEGRFRCDRVCDPCREATAEFEHTVLGGFFWEAMREEWSNGARLQACLNRLTTAAAKRRMYEQWTRWREGRR